FSRIFWVRWILSVLRQVGKPSRFSTANFGFRSTSFSTGSHLLMPGMFTATWPTSDPSTCGRHMDSVCESEPLTLFCAWITASNSARGPESRAESSLEASDGHFEIEAHTDPPSVKFRTGSARD